MSDYYCPDCGDRPMRQSRETAFHVCEGCLKRFVVIELPASIAGMVSILDAQELTPVRRDNRMSLGDGVLVDGGD